jgi:hypothetical protein
MMPRAEGNRSHHGAPNAGLLAQREPVCPVIKGYWANVSQRDRRTRDISFELTSNFRRCLNSSRPIISIADHENDRRGLQLPCSATSPASVTPFTGGVFLLIGPAYPRGNANVVSRDSIGSLRYLIAFHRAMLWRTGGQDHAPAVLPRLQQPRHDNCSRSAGKAYLQRMPSQMGRADVGSIFCRA